MKRTEYWLALGLAVALLAVNFAISIIAMLIYSAAIEPGHDAAYYNQAALRIVPWAVGIAAPILFALVGYRAARRHPERNPYLFAATVWLIYLALDMIAASMMNALAATFSLASIVQLLGHLVAALLGAWLATRSRTAAAL